MKKIVLLASLAIPATAFATVKCNTVCSPAGCITCCPSGCTVGSGLDLKPSLILHPELF